MGGDDPREEGIYLISIEGTSAPDGEPFEVDLDARPEARGSGKQLSLGRAVYMREVMRQAVEEGL